nr:protein LITTLE ZIPPER 3 [Ipomoea trifida]GMD86849.1 protein LITTLE ZIPPER 3 [Ipomoea batatas]GMD88183.1 protein LITTLE ZIPPER 3 [Ipomoea batatas]
MEKINSKLYMENCYIMAENERLRKKAEVLNKENQALLKELKKKNCSSRLARGPSPPTANKLPDLNIATPNSPNN